MNLLVFDTATPATVAGISEDPAAVFALLHVPAPGERPGHASELLPMVNSLLDVLGIGFRDLDRIGVGVGPGTFTGLRIGVATARALAQGAGAELVGVSTLHALAEAARAEEPDGRVLAVLDARRGEAFVAAYEDGREVLAPQAVKPEALPDLARGARLAVGDGAVRFRDVLAPSGIGVPADGSPLHQVSAQALARLAAAAVPGDPAQVAPDYVRVPDAELARRKREGEAAA